MATASGMDPTKMIALMESVKSRSDSILDIFDELKEQIPSAVAACYDGDAAEAFKTTISTQATTMRGTLEEISNKLQTNFNEMQTQYSMQDTKLAGSLGSN